MTDGAPIAEGFLVIADQAALDALAARIGTGRIPPQYRTPDFAQSNLVYLEGTGDNDPASAVRIVDAGRNAEGVRLNGEFCGNPVSTIPAHRPFALYVVPSLEGTMSVEWSLALLPNCVAVKRVNVTLRSSGLAAGDGVMPSRVFRGAGELDPYIIHMLGPLGGPYDIPDFSKASLIYVEGGAADNTGAYVRILHVYENLDGSYDVRTEFCKEAGAAANPYTPHALYLTAVPLPGTARFDMVTRTPPAQACLAPRT